MLILGIENSCDETGVALYDSEHGLLSQVLHSQVALHADYGGVVPELASRDRAKNYAINRASAEGREQTLDDIDGIAYTAGPGLMGALWLVHPLQRASRGLWVFRPWAFTTWRRTFWRR